MSTTLTERILTILRRFEFGDKMEIARELAEALEWQRGEALSALVQSALGRDLSREELFKVDTLEFFLEDRGLEEPSFPEGLPKSGR